MAALKLPERACASRPYEVLGTNPLEEDKNKLGESRDRELFIANNRVVVRTIDQCVRRI